MASQPPPSLLDEMLKIDPVAVLSLFKAQAIIKQRREDEDKPKAALSVTGLTREQAQRVADDLCRYVRWGTEDIAPALNV